jgi:hypothetical protein
METQVFETGLLLMVAAVVMRLCSEDDVAKVAAWWKYTVYSTFGVAAAMIFLSALMMIWT